MKKILIINLRRYGDILSTSHLINKIKDASQENKIYILTMYEFQQITKILNGIEKTFTIDRKKIITVLQKKIFNDAMAINIFQENLHPVSEIIWDEVINYSNDLVGTYICSYLKSITPSAKIKGIYYNEKMSLISNNLWPEIFNQVITTYRHTPFHFNDLHSRICDLKNETQEKHEHKKSRYYKTPITQKKNDLIANGNFEKLRNYLLQKNGQEPKIVGIQCKASSPEKELTQDEVLGLLIKILENPAFYPILLIAPNSEEKKSADFFSQKLNQNIVIIEADLQALPSVVKNLDLLITPDTLIKHLADLFEIPLIEISKGPSPYLKQGTCLPYNYILTPVHFSRFNSSIPESSVSAEDIYQTLLLMTGKTHQKKKPLSSGVTLYQSRKDSFGIIYHYLHGAIDIEHELSKFMARLYIATISSRDTDDQQILDEKSHFYSFLHQFKMIKLIEINVWISTQITHITHCGQSLLATLRDLKQAQINPKNGHSFTKSLDKLLQFSDLNYLCSIPTALFRGRIETLFHTDKKKIEGLIYLLKSDLQIIINLLQNFEHYIDSLEKENLTEKYSKSHQKWGLEVRD